MKLVDMVKKVANGVKIHHYVSQPMPRSYTKPMELPFRQFKELRGNPQPNAIQQAFMDAVIRG